MFIFNCISHSAIYEGGVSKFMYLFQKLKKLWQWQYCVKSTGNKKYIDLSPMSNHPNFMQEFTPWKEELLHKTRITGSREDDFSLITRSESRY